MMVILFDAHASFNIIIPILVETTLPNEPYIYSHKYRWPHNWTNISNVYNTFACFLVGDVMKLPEDLHLKNNQNVRLVFHHEDIKNACLFTLQSPEHSHFMETMILWIFCVYNMYTKFYAIRMWKGFCACRISHSIQPKGLLWSLNGLPFSHSHAYHIM